MHSYPSLSSRLNTFISDIDSQMPSVNWTTSTLSHSDHSRQKSASFWIIGTLISGQRHQTPVGFLGSFVLLGFMKATLSCSPTITHTLGYTSPPQAPKTRIILRDVENSRGS